MVSHRNVYLDYSATTPTDPRVLEKMLPYFTDEFGNTSSAHSYGRRAEDAIETARETIATLMNCRTSEIIFTSGGSESDNLAIRGAAWSRLDVGNHLVTTPVEHSAVTRTVSQLVAFSDFDSAIVPVDKTASVDVEELLDNCNERTTLVSIIYANNEVGTTADMPRIAAQLRERGILFHTDAVQSAGQMTLDVQALGVDLLSISAHKFYGPKGVGALYCRDGINLAPSQTGGSHEAGRRAGTLNTPAIVGMAEALRLAYEERDERLAHYTRLRDMLKDGILEKVSDCQITGHPVHRLPSHISFVFEDVDSTRLLMHLDLMGISASGASACKTGNAEPSSVLLAMGYAPELAIGSLRLTVGQTTTEEDVAYAIEGIAAAVEKVRKLKRIVS